MPLVVARVDFGTQHLVGMQIGVPGTPLGQVTRALGLLPRGDEHAVLRLIPVDGGLVHVVPRELVEDQQRCEPREPVECGAERVDVMQNTARNNCVERSGLVEVFERDLPVERALGSLGIDRQHVVTLRRERRRNAALVTTADLEHPSRRLG